MLDEFEKQRKSVLGTRATVLIIGLEVEQRLSQVAREAPSDLHISPSISVFFLYEKKKKKERNKQSKNNRSGRRKRI